MISMPNSGSYKQWLKRQAERRAKIKSLLATGQSKASVARRFRISRERIRQLALSRDAK